LFITAVFSQKASAILADTFQVDLGLFTVQPELDASSRRSSEMASIWRSLYPVVDCSGLMLMMMLTGVVDRSNAERETPLHPIKARGENEEF
jgi:hypothetical protein